MKSKDLSKAFESNDIEFDSLFDDMDEDIYVNIMLQSDQNVNSALPKQDNSQFIKNKKLAEK